MKILKHFSYLMLLLIQSSAMAGYSSNGGDLISASDNVNQLLVIAVQLLVIGLFCLGFSFICVSLAKYKKHRKMPTFVPLQTVLLMFFGGIVMILLGILYIYTGESIFGPDYMSILSSGQQGL